MSINTTLTLIQFIVLALPAIAIYMTLAFDVRKSFVENDLPKGLQGTPEGDSRLGHSYHAMRASILALLAGGLLLFIHLLMILPPDLAGEWAKTAAGGVFLTGVLFLMAGVGIFGFAVAFQMAALQDDLTVPRSLEIVVKDQFVSFVKRILPW